MPEEGLGRIGTNLKRLQDGLGLRNERLVELISDDLRKHWAVGESMRPEDARKVVWERLKPLASQAIAGMKTTGKQKEKAHLVFRVRYNQADDFPATVLLDFFDRAAWLETKAPMGLMTPRRTQDFWINKILLYIEKKMVAELTSRSELPAGRPKKQPAFKVPSRRRLLLGLTVGGAVAAGAALLSISLLADSAEDVAKQVTSSDALRVSLLRPEGYTDSSIAFQDRQSDIASRFLGSDPLKDDNFIKALDAGAFALDGLVLHLTVANMAEDELTIFDVRPVQSDDPTNYVTPEPIATGTLIYVSPYGGADPDEVLMFDLDESPPTARKTMKGEPFFGSQKISLPQGETRGLALTLVATQAAYSFNIAIDYNIGGAQYTEIVTLDGKPFKASANACWKQSDLEALSAEHRQLVEPLRYGRIESWDVEIGVGRAPSSVTPEHFADVCRRWGSYAPDLNP